MPKYNMSELPSRDRKRWTPQIDNKMPDLEFIDIQISGIDAGLKVDKKPQLTASGATVTFNGLELVNFDLNFVAWENVGQALIHEYVSLLFPAVTPSIKDKPNANKNIVPIPIYHATLQYFGVSSFFVESISGPHFVDFKWTMTAKCCQWAPPPKASAATTKSTTPVVAKPVFGETSAPVQVPPPQQKPVEKPSVGAAKAVTPQRK